MKRVAIFSVGFLMLFSLSARLTGTMSGGCADFAPPDGGTSAVQIPKGSAVTIDGKINDDEWRGAFVGELVGGGEVRLLQSDSNLYVGLRGLKQGWGHVYVIEGDTIRVLHASAALGTAIYRRNGGTWQPTQPFDWELRDRVITDATKAAMSKFFEANGWVANNVNMSNSFEVEYKVHGKFFTGAARMAVLFASHPQSPLHWPKSLADDAVAEQLVRGNTPTDLRFDVTTWAQIKL